VPMFRQTTSPNSKVISVSLLHFMRIFYSFLKKVVREAPFSVESALIRFGHSLAHVKIWLRSTPYWPKYGLLKKLILVGKH